MRSLTGLAIKPAPRRPADDAVRDFFVSFLRKSLLKIIIITVEVAGGQGVVPQERGESHVQSKTAHTLTFSHTFNLV